MFIIHQSSQHVDEVRCCPEGTKTTRESSKYEVVVISHRIANMSASIMAVMIAVVLQSVCCFPLINLLPCNSRWYRQGRACTWMVSDATEIPRQTLTRSGDIGHGSSSASIGKWEELDGNFILRPSIEDGPPRALGMCHAGWTRLRFPFASDL